jgi:hypothetical protein
MVCQSIHMLYVYMYHIVNIITTTIYIVHKTLSSGITLHSTELMWIRKLKGEKISISYWCNTAFASTSLTIKTLIQKLPWQNGNNAISLNSSLVNQKLVIKSLHRPFINGICTSCKWLIYWQEQQFYRAQRYMMKILRFDEFTVMEVLECNLINENM